MAERKNKVDVFCDETSSITAFHYLHSEYTTTLRITSGFLVVVCIALTVYQVADRIGWYIDNPLVTVIEEGLMQKEEVPFPAMYICNNMQFRISRSNVAKFDSEDSDVIELIGKLKSKNQTTRAKAVELLKKIPQLVQRLKNMAAIYNSSSASHVCRSQAYQKEVLEVSRLCSKEFLSQLGPELENELLYMQSVLKDYLPKTYVYTLNFLNSLNLEGIYDKLHYKASLKGWTWGYMKKTMCVYPWNCSFHVAASMLNTIANYSIANLSENTRQSETEFMLRCLWENGRRCATEPKYTSHGLCYKIIPEHIQKTGSLKLTILLNLEQYDGIPGLPSGEAKDSEGKNEKAFSLLPGHHWQIGIHKVIEISRHFMKCGKKKLKYFDVYSNTDCEWERKVDEIVQSCKCIPAYIWNAIDLKVENV